MQPSTEIDTDAEKGDVVKPWSYSTWFITLTKKRIAIGLIILIAVILIVVLPILYREGYINEGYAGPFSLWGTPDWSIRNKGHMHQERSDSHVSKPKTEKWNIATFKKSVRDLNKKAKQ